MLRARNLVIVREIAVREIAMLERDAQRARAIQVGMLMRAYRESFPLEGGGRGLTQEELLRRMATVDGDYAQRYSHTTVSRWESGATRPSRERLEVFGRTLNLSQFELAGLMSLAGFTGDDQPRPDGADFSNDEEDRDAAPISQAEQTGLVVTIDTEQAGSRLLSGPFPSISQVLVSCFFPTLVTIGGAYLLASLGWNQRWMPIAYIGVVLGTRLGGAFLRLARPFDLCEFLCISLFVLLTTPLLQSAALNMDHYGFCAIPGMAGTPMPFMLALLVNLFVSTIAGAVFFALWNWQYGTPKVTGNPVQRAALVASLPVGLVYVTMAVATNMGILLQLGVSFAVLAGVCVILLLIRDSTITPHERDRRFLLWAILIVGMVMTTIGAGAMLAIFLTPNLPAMLPDHNLLYSWAIDYEMLDQTPEETLRRFNLGYLWHATTVFVYMVFGVGGNLIAAVYRWSGDPPRPQTAGAPVPNPGTETAEPSTLRKVIAFFRGILSNGLY